MKYRFCPLCGSNLISPPKSNGASEYESCRECGFVNYKNPKPCVGAVIIEDDEVLLTRRANKPFKNYWDFPGGFLESGELPEEGLQRELDEELSIDVKIMRILGIYPDTYGPEGASTLNIYYLCKVSTEEIIPDHVEIAKVKWFAIDTLPSKLAFGHVKLVLEKWKISALC